MQRFVRVCAGYLLAGYGCEVPVQGVKLALVKRKQSGASNELKRKHHPGAVFNLQAAQEIYMMVNGDGKGGAQGFIERDTTQTTLPARAIATAVVKVSPADAGSACKFKVESIDRSGPWTADEESAFVEVRPEWATSACAGGPAVGYVRWAALTPAAPYACLLLTFIISGLLSKTDIGEQICHACWRSVCCWCPRMTCETSLSYMFDLCFKPRKMWYERSVGESEDEMFFKLKSVKKLRYPNLFPEIQPSKWESAQRDFWLPSVLGSSDFLRQALVDLQIRRCDEDLTFYCRSEREVTLEKLLPRFFALMDLVKRDAERTENTDEAGKVWVVRRAQFFIAIIEWQIAHGCINMDYAAHFDFKEVSEEVSASWTLKCPDSVREKLDRCVHPLLVSESRIRKLPEPKLDLRPLR